MMRITHGIARVARTTSGARIAISTACACSAKALAAGRPSPSKVRANIGTKPALKAPSANSRRRKLGSLKATKNASANGPAPSTAAIMMSRTKPSTLEIRVIEPMVATERSRPIGRAVASPGVGSAATARRSRLLQGRLGGGLAGQSRSHPALDLADLRGLADLQPEHVLDVEHVHHALAIGADVGARDDHAEILERLGDVVQEAGPVAAVDLEHGVGAARPVIEQHPRPDVEHVGALGQRAAAGERPIEPDLASQRLLDVAPDAPEPSRVCNG